MQKRTVLTGISIALLGLTSCAHKKPHHRNNLKHIIVGKHRSQKNIDRNTYRHPQETLRFFEVRPDMKVAEISPGAGWYMEILGPYLKNSGQYYITKYPEQGPEYFKKLNKMADEKMADKTTYGHVHAAVFMPGKIIEDIAPENTLDRVLTFRNLHNWMKGGKAKEALAAFYKALKPGGILGVVDHRAPFKAPLDKQAKTGYVKEDYAIELIKSVGFEFVAKSEINANYLDQANHKAGVWNLPPTLKGVKEKDLSYFQAIGESDRFTLKFRKPLK